MHSSPASAEGCVRLYSKISPALFLKKLLDAELAAPCDDCSTAPRLKMSAAVAIKTIPTVVALRTAREGL